jgi:hypothetical protein
MSTSKVNVVARDPKREELSTQPILSIVGAGSELTRLPTELFDLKD